MNCQITLDAAAGRMSLSGELSVYSVAEIHACLADALAARDTLEVDLAGVTDIDCAGLQLMLLTRQQAGKTVRFAHPSAPIKRLADLANLGRLLDDAPASTTGE